MILFDGMSGIEYQITGIYVEYVIERRLEALGLNEGTCIKIITRKKNCNPKHSIVSRTSLEVP